MRKISFYNYGDPSVLTLTEAPKPQPEEDEVLIKVSAAGVNPIDFKTRNGSLKYIAPGKLPRTPGVEIAGTIEKLGSAVKRFKTGDGIFAMMGMIGGGYAEYISLKEDLVSKIPSGITLQEAASVPLGSLTALQSLRDYGKLTSGMKVLINGASGGVGIYGVQIAKALGAHVTAVCSGRNMEFVKNFGADQIIDYQKNDFTKSNNKYDLVFDAVATSSPGKCKRIISKGGSYVSTIPAPGLMLQQATNFLRSRKAFGMLCKSGHKDLDFIASLITEGKIKTSIEKVFDLKDASDAHFHIETGRTRGKLIIKMPH
jgi:NADPH:quinone reductase-like Zn-dependent oxidoreductase